MTTSLTHHRLRAWLAVSLLALLAGGSRRAAAEDLYLADDRLFPGQLWLSEGFTAERPLFRREPRPLSAAPRSVPKLGQVAVGPDGFVYFCSGLDGYIMHLMNGRHEVVSHEFAGQIRDLACTGEAHTIYFSVVPTPQNGEPLADGKIYRLDFYSGRPVEIATVRQSDMGGHWWGTFTIVDGQILLATLEDSSRLFRLTTNGPQRVYEQNTAKITGLGVGPDRDLYFTTGTGHVFRTRDFQRSDEVVNTGRRVSDVALRASHESPRP